VKRKIFAVSIVIMMMLAVAASGAARASNFGFLLARAEWKGANGRTVRGQFVSQVFSYCWSDHPDRAIKSDNEHLLRQVIKSVCNCDDYQISLYQVDGPWGEDYAKSSHDRHLADKFYQVRQEFHASTAYYTRCK